MEWRYIIISHIGKVKLVAYYIRACYLSLSLAEMQSQFASMLRCQHLRHMTHTVHHNTWLYCELCIWLLFKTKLSDEVLAWLSVCSKVQMICIWSSWCHSHPIFSCFIKIQNGSAFLVLAYPGSPSSSSIFKNQFQYNAINGIYQWNQAISPSVTQ